MKTWFEANRDFLKLGVVVLALLGMGALFFITPALSGPTAISIVLTMLFSPFAVALERRGFSRGMAILILFGAGIATISAVSVALVSSGSLQWDKLQHQAPLYFNQTVARLGEFESSFKSQYAFLSGINPTAALAAWGQSTGTWFATNGPSLAGAFLSWLFIVPIITFVLLKDGPTIRRSFFKLIPNRYFESLFLVVNKISTALADYLRAKLLEAFLVGLMVTIGLILVGCPYPVVLGIVAGITNIIPYIGPIFGAVPGLLIVLLDPSAQELLWPVVLVYTVANVVDTVLIFPVLVAKLVNLHPLILIATVIAGQEYYGLLGMLLSIPLASAMKVVFQELYVAIYQRRPLSVIRIRASNTAGPTRATENIIPFVSGE